MNVFKQQQQPYTETEVAEILGLSRQTLRNWRAGHSKRGREYGPVLEEGRHWYKLRNTRCSPVLYSPEWVEGMKEINKMKISL